MNRQPPERTDPQPKEAEPALLPRQHSGEGSASALENLRKLENSRMPDARPNDVPEGDA